MKQKLQLIIQEMHNSGITYEEATKEFKKLFIAEVMNSNKHNQCKSARELSIHRNTLGRTLNKLFPKPVQSVKSNEYRKRLILGSW